MMRLIVLLPCECVFILVYKIYLLIILLFASYFWASVASSNFISSFLNYNYSNVFVVHQKYKYSKDINSVCLVNLSFCINYEKVCCELRICLF